MSALKKASMSSLAYRRQHPEIVLAEVAQNGDVKLAHVDEAARRIRDWCGANKSVWIVYVFLWSARACELRFLVRVACEMNERKNE